MPIKESSDELNPPVAVPASEVAPPKRRRTFSDYVALAIATCGVGYIPIAPGTWGSMVGVMILLRLRPVVFEIFEIRFAGRIQDDAWRLFFERSFFTSILLLVVIALSIIGIWAASRAERLLGRKDPKAVVIDEVVGQLITYVFVFDFIGPIGIAMGFVLFRAFDIIKPYPIRRLEGLHGGLGIVADDILAGLYAGTVLLILSTLSSLRVIP